MSGNVLHERDSRREVQRRFPPGAFGVCKQSNLLFTVVGWSQVPAVIEPNSGPAAIRKLKEVSSWEVVVLLNNRLIRKSWSAISTDWTLNEWLEMPSLEVP